MFHISDSVSDSGFNQSTNQPAVPSPSVAYISQACIQQQIHYYVHGSVIGGSALDLGILEIDALYATRLCRAKHYPRKITTVGAGAEIKSELTGAWTPSIASIPLRGFLVIIKFCIVTMAITGRIWKHQAFATTGTTCLF